MSTLAEQQPHPAARPAAPVPADAGGTGYADAPAAGAGFGRHLVHAAASQQQFRALVDQVIVWIDRLLGRQVDAILHHPRFQRLEASWRGLEHLVAVQARHDDELAIRVRVLNISWREVARDVTRALEFDQSQLFNRIYSEEFGTPGGEPFGVLLGDYAVSHRPRTGVPASDEEVLGELARISAAALCPLILGADSALLGLDSFRELRQPQDFDAVFRQREYAGWHRLRQDEHTRFIGLAVPRVLMREPYRPDGTRRDGFPYREDTTGDAEQYLWGNACFAFGSVVMRAFAETGWFADIRGDRHGHGGGGIVPSLAGAVYDGEAPAVASRSVTEVQLDDFGERELADAGLIPLCAYHGPGFAVFHSNDSLHRPPPQGGDFANLNARLSGMMQYMLCASRFGHHIKVIGRDKIGSFVNAADCQKLLQDWLNRYSTASDGPSTELKARYPLAASRVEVTEQPGRPGHFTCVVHLQPHFQLDQLVTSIRLVTELAIGPTGTGDI